MSQKLIYLIDDEEEILEVWADYLTDKYSVKKFQNPKETLELIDKNEHPHLFVVDYCMQPMSGMDLINQLHSRDLKIPVIIVTGAADKKLLIGAIRKGIVAGILDKPVAEEKFTSIIDEVITKYEQEQVYQSLLYDHNIY